MTTQDQARRMAEEAAQVPLAEQLASVPETARLSINDADGMGTQYIPVGRMCKEAAAALVKYMQQERWVVVRESVLDVGFGDDVRTGGRPELGYALLPEMPTFGSEEAASAAITELGLPLGWVRMPLSRLLPDISANPTPSQQEERVRELEEALDQIGGLCSALRQGGPAPQDLEGLSAALQEAVDTAHAALAARKKGRGK